MSAFHDFFWGEKKSLLQSMFEAATKALFSGLVVAAIGMLVFSELESYSERSAKRAAFNALRNAALSKAIRDANNAYISIDCARDFVQVIETDCQNQLSSMVALLRVSRARLTALFPGRDFSSITVMINTIDRMKQLGRDTSENDKVRSRIEDFNTAYADMVNTVARNF